MREEWPKIALGEVATLYDSLHKTPKYSDDGYPMVRVTDIKGETLNTDSCKRVNEETFLEFTKKRLPQKGDILFSRVGSYGNSLLVKTKEHFCLGQNTVSIVANSDAVLPEYMFAFLNSHEAKAQIESFIGGASQPTISLGNIKRILVPKPPLAQQYRISSVLSSYNDLIENNTRRIEILEEMARRLYEEWFVHFRFPGHEEVSFKESELGEIPEGWEVKLLGEVAELSWGDTKTTKKSYTDAGYIAYSAAGPDGFLPYFDHDRPGIVLSAIGANCGLTWLALEKWSCIKNTIKFWPVDDLVGCEYLYLATHGKEYWPKRGAAQPFISQGDARGCKIIVPPSSLHDRFQDVAKGAFRLASVLHKKNANLRTQRDLLLPKLVSGEIDVSDIPMPDDKEVEAA